MTRQGHPVLRAQMAAPGHADVDRGLGAHRHRVPTPRAPAAGADLGAHVVAGDPVAPQVAAMHHTAVLDGQLAGDLYTSGPKGATWPPRRARAVGRRVGLFTLDGSLGGGHASSVGR